MTISRNCAALGLLLGCLCAAPAAPAQTPAPAPGTPPQTRPTPPRDILSGDPRLDTKVTLRRTKVFLPDALRELTKQTQVRLAVGGNELPGDTVALAVTGEPLRDVMRAVAAINDGHWKRVKDADGKDVLTLMDKGENSRFWDFLRPKTQAEADMDQGLADFAHQFSQLPPDAQQGLAYSDKGDPISLDAQGTSFAALPPAMQQSLRQAFQAKLQMFATDKFPTHLTLDSLSDMHVAVQVNTGDATVYTFHVNGPPNHDGLMMSLISPGDPSALDNTVRPPDFVPWQGNEPQAVADWYAAARAWSLKADPRLARPVSVKTDDDTLGFTLAALADAAHVNAVAQVYPMSHTVSLSGVPLRDALDQVTAKYRAVWGEAPDGTLLVRYTAYPGTQAAAAN